MKKIVLIGIALLSLLSTLSAKNSSKVKKYESITHLHTLFKKLKKTTSINQDALSEAFYYYEKNRYSKKLSSDYLAIADYTKTAMEKRLYVINLHSGKVRSYLVAHGTNSGAKGGRVWRSSNKRGSYMTPHGFFKIGTKEGISTRKKYKYLNVEGLEKKNRNAKKRQILLHTAPYVSKAGRSHGCFAILPKDRWQVFSRLKKALFYSYIGH